MSRHALSDCTFASVCAFSDRHRTADVVRDAMLIRYSTDANVKLIADTSADIERASYTHAAMALTACIEHVNTQGDAMARSPHSTAIFDVELSIRTCRCRSASGGLQTAARCVAQAFVCCLGNLSAQAQEPRRRPVLEGRLARSISPVAHTSTFKTKHKQQLRQFSIVPGAEKQPPARWPCPAVARRSPVQLPEQQSAATRNRHKEAVTCGLRPAPAAPLKR